MQILEQDFPACQTASITWGALERADSQAVYRTLEWGMEGENLELLVLTSLLVILKIVSFGNTVLKQMVM